MSKSGVEKKGWWVGQETLADCWILHGPLKLRLCGRYSIRNDRHISCSEQLICEWLDTTLNHRKAPTISSIETRNFFSSLALVMCWLCWAVCGSARLRKARSRSDVRVLAVNPLKLDLTLTNFWTQVMTTKIHRVSTLISFPFIFFLAAVNFTISRLSDFWDSHRKRKRWLNDIYIYPLQAFMSRPQHREA